MKYCLHFIKYLWGKKENRVSCEIMMSHSKSHEIYYSYSKSPHCARKVNSHFCTVMSELASITLPQSAWGLGRFWGHLRCVKQYSFSCYLNMEKPQVRKFENIHPGVSVATGGMEPFVCAVTKAREQFIWFVHPATFCVFPLCATFLLLKMLHLMEQLVLKATMFCFSLV